MCRNWMMRPGHVLVRYSPIWHFMTEMRISRSI
uniref:Uncharacterized protein n=1 Tax=Ascaris lumbricoides TaxID=6252 RepID=A0A0M3HKK5_ASCLU